MDKNPDTGQNVLPLFCTSQHWKISSILKLEKKLQRTACRQERLLHLDQEA